MGWSKTRPGRTGRASTAWKGSGASWDDADPHGGDKMTTGAAGSSWKDAEVAGKFLDERRRLAGQGGVVRVPHGLRPADRPLRADAPAGAGGDAAVLGPV